MIHFVELNAKFVHTNLAIRYFTQAANTFGVPVVTTRTTINQPFQLLVRAIFDKRADVVFFSCYIWNMDLIIRLSKAVKAIRPHVKIVIGGPEVSFNDQAWMQDHPCFDALICHEGEAWFNTWFKAYATDAEAAIASLKGIYYPDQIQNLDLLGVPYSHQELQQESIVYYESSRGCPYKCAYCMSARASTMRYKSLDQVKKDLTHLLSYPIKTIKFVDRTFNFPEDRAVAILHHLADSDNGVTTCHFELSPNLLSDELISVISGLRKDLVQFEIGIQSTHEPTLKTINRHMPLHTFGQVKKLCALTSCHTHLDLIAGLPHESLMHFEKSFNDVLSLKPDHLQLGMLKLLKGSQMLEEASIYGYTYDHSPPYEFFTNHVLTYEDKVELVNVEEGVESIYNSGLFTTSLAYLHSQLSSAFTLYSNIGAKLINNSLYGFPDGLNSKVSMLMDLALDLLNIPQETMGALLAADLLTLDQKIPDPLKVYQVDTHGKWMDALRLGVVPLPIHLKDVSLKTCLKQLRVMFVPARLDKGQLVECPCWLFKFKGHDQVFVVAEVDAPQLKELKS